MKDVAAAERVRVFHVLRRDHLPVEDEAGEVRRVVGEGPGDRVAQSLALAAPVSVPQLEGRKLRRDRHHVMAGGRKRWIGDGGDGNIQDGMSRELSVLGGVKSPFQVIQLRADVDAACQRRACRVPSTLERDERRHARQRQVHLGHGSLAPVVLHLDHEAGVEVRGIEQAQESSPRVGIGDHGLASHHLATRQHHAGD